MMLVKSVSNWSSELFEKSVFLDVGHYWDSEA